MSDGLVRPAETRSALQPRSRIRIGYVFGTYRPVPGDDFLADGFYREAAAAEAAGFDSLWLADHLMQTPVVAPVDDPILECYVALGALAGVTTSVRLGAFVGAAGFRNPALLGKMVTTLDVLSRGRAVFGIGAGWYEEEHRAYGLEFGSAKERLDRLEEVVEVVQTMFQGDPRNHPQPVQPGGPPTLIGGSGERRTLRMVAERADICNVAGTCERVQHLMSVLDGHCADIGRDPSAVWRTYITPVIVRDSREEALAAVPDHYRNRTMPVLGTRDEVLAQLCAIRDAGIDGFIVSCVEADRTQERLVELADICREALS